MDLIARYARESRFKSRSGHGNLTQTEERGEGKKKKKQTCVRLIFNLVLCLELQGEETGGGKARESKMGNKASPQAKEATDTLYVRPPIG
jgi:hypothetical protein